MDGPLSGPQINHYFPTADCLNIGIKSPTILSMAGTGLEKDTETSPSPCCARNVVTLARLPKILLL